MPFAPVVTPHPVTHRAFFESQGRLREEYLEGVRYPLPAVDRTHQMVLDNLLQCLKPQMRQSPCEMFQDAMVGNGPTPGGRPTGRHSHATEGAFVRPDLVIMLDRPAYFVPSSSVIINPSVLIEVLSPGEQDYATGTRFEALRQWLDRTFHDYVLVVTQHPEVAHYTRVGRDDWTLAVYTNLEDVLALPRIHCAVMVAELYGGVRDKAGRPFVRPDVCPHCGHAL